MQNVESISLNTEEAVYNLYITYINLFVHIATS